MQFWQAEMEPFDHHERLFRIIKQVESDHIGKDDFVPYLQELLHFHPGLDFLESHEEFQRKYALTVITRIFYKVIIASGCILHGLSWLGLSDFFGPCPRLGECVPQRSHHSS